MFKRVGWGALIEQFTHFENWKFEWDLFWIYDYNENATQKKNKLNSQTAC